MCGIGGYLGEALRPPDHGALLLGHRGPDAQGTHSFQTRTKLLGYLAAARLAISDPSAAANQPMESADGKRFLVYNGEIYNQDELRAQILALGMPLRSRSDTEIILEGYGHFGSALFARLRGMFAFALWDGATDELWLVRDGMGIKPLYYVHDQRRLCFASEMRALLAASAVGRRIDRSALAGFLTWGSVPEPQAFVAGVKLVPPGQALRQSARMIGGKLVPLELLPFAAPHSSMHSRLIVPDAGQATAQLATALHDTVARHVQADVPAGLLLSGGVDSTALSLMMRKAAPAEPFLALTLANDHVQDGEESIARKTARLLKLPHRICQVNAEQALAATPRFVAALDQPSSDGFNTFLICEAVRASGYKLVLSGLGGDELFWGYGFHRRFAAMYAGSMLLGQAPAQAAVAARLYRFFRGLFPSWMVQRFLHPVHRPPNEVLPLLALPSALPPQNGRAKDCFAQGLQIVRELERQNYLRHTLLRDGDVMSMVHGVELRVPFCDQNLWALVATLGPLAFAEQKQLLVQAALQGASEPAARHLATVAKQRKRGFVLPMSAWLRGPLWAALQARFADDDLLRAAGLCAPSLRRLLLLYEQAPEMLRERLSSRIWALYVLLSYIEQHGLRID